MKNADIIYGVVIDVDHDEKEFVAILRNDRQHPCTFGFDMLKEEDRNLISIGNSFRWIIGHNNWGRPSCKTFSEIKLGA